jgi:hypothetical protein
VNITPSWSIFSSKKLQIIDGIHFLLQHGRALASLTADTVFVTQSGNVKIGMFQMIQLPHQINNTIAQLQEGWKKAVKL